MGFPDPGSGGLVRVNLGCGDRYAGGWHNVDHAGSPHRKDATVDLTGPVPWAPGTIKLAYAGHILEHLTIDQCVKLLADLRPCMAFDGTLMIVGPDLNRARLLAEVGKLDVTLDSLQFGGHRWPGDEHRWECIPEIIIEMLTATGWQNISEFSIGNVPAIWPVADRGPVWQCAVQANP